MDRQRLGDQVKRRRSELGLSVSKAARAAGLSRTTWIAAEAGSRETHSYNYAPIERTLRWEPGSVEAVLAGRDPKPANAVTVVSEEPRHDPAAILAGIVEILRSRYSAGTKIAMIEDIIATDYRPELWRHTDDGVDVAVDDGTSIVVTQVKNHVQDGPQATGRATRQQS